MSNKEVISFHLRVDLPGKTKQEEPNTLVCSAFVSVTELDKSRLSERSHVRVLMSGLYSQIEDMIMREFKG